MKTTHSNLTIFMLLASAAVLTGMLVMTYNDTAQVAQAGMPSDRAGQYIMVPGMVSSSYEMVYVVDIVSDQINAYIVNPQSNRLILSGTKNLQLMFRSRD